MENVQTKNRDLSWGLMAIVIVATFLLTGCNFTKTTPVIDEAPEKAVDTSAVIEAPSNSLADGEVASGELAEKMVLQEKSESEVAALPAYSAGAIQAYSEETFNAAIADGKTVLLDFHASWCSICVGNAPIIKSALQKEGNVVGLQINYDTAHDLRVKYGVVSQSTLILLQNGQEITRAMGPQSDQTMMTLLNS